MGCDTTTNPYNDLLLPGAATEQFELQLQLDHQWRNVETQVPFDFNLALETLLKDIGSLFSKEDIPHYEVWVLHRPFELKEGEVLVSSRVGEKMIVQPKIFNEELVEDRWDSSGRPLRYREPSDTNDKSVSKPSQKFWDDFKRLTVRWGITILGVGVAPSDAVSLIKNGNVLLGRPRPEDREQVVTVEPWSDSEKVFSIGWLTIKPNSNPNDPNQVSNYVRSNPNESWLRYVASAPVGGNGITSTIGTTQNCVNQCGPM